VTAGRDEQRAIRASSTEAEERVAAMKVRAEHAEVLVNVLTDAAARAGGHDGPDAKRARFD
jgi:hypothetical protein